MSDVDVDEWEDRWKDWTDDIQRLRIGVNDREKADRLADIRDELKAIIEDAAAEKRLEEADDET